MERTKHIALVSKPALFHPDFDAGNPCIRQFVEIPEGYANSDFTVNWITHAGMMRAVFRFETWPVSLSGETR